MSLNVPSYTENNFGFGPGIVYIGAAGATPTVDAGALHEDGLKLTPIVEVTDIVQGNPKIPVYSYANAQGVMLEFSGIEWNQNLLAYGIGAAATASSGSADSWTFGGDPILKRVAIRVQHQMAVSGHTMDFYAWKCVTAGAPELPLTHDTHKFPLKFKALRSATDWAGTALAYTDQLIKVVRTK